MTLFRYIGILGELFRHGTDAWDALGPDGRSLFLDCARRDGIEYFVRWKLGKRLPDPLQQNFTTAARKRQLDAVRHECGLIQFTRLLDRENCRYAVLKGAELAWRVYPAPAMRSFADWDILLHPEDCDRTLALFDREDWKPLHDLPREHCHHYPLRTKNHYFLEPHWTLPGFRDIPPQTIWSYLTPPADNTSSRFRLPADFLVLVMARHCSEAHYSHINVGKLLLDLAFLDQQEHLDWNRIRSLADELKLPQPNDFFAAYREFFTPEQLAAIHPDEPTAAQWRELLAYRWESREATPAEMSLGDEKSWSASWFRKHAQVWHTRNMRTKYGLPDSGATWRLCCAYVRDIGHKLTTIARYLCTGHRTINRYHQLENKLENIRK